MPCTLSLLQPTSGFDYSAEAYVAALQQFVAALGIKQPFALVVQVGGWVSGGGGGWLAQEGCVPPRQDRLTAAASCLLIC
jgi:hypothetical protein